MFANSRIITQRIGLSVHRLAGQHAGYSRLINNGTEQTFDTKISTLKNYERLSLQDQIIVRNRLRYATYTPLKVEKMTEGVDEKSKRLEQNTETTEGVDKANC